MTKPGYTAIALLIDSSGSMESIRSDTEGMINGFIKEQAGAEGHRTIRIWTFSNELDPKGWLRQFCPSKPAGEIDRFVLQPYGGTALLDAMGTTIAQFGDELAEMPEDERPEHVIHAVMTDGMENSSKEYSWDAVNAASLRQQETYGWNIVYMGANQDAIKVGNRLGVHTNSTLSYEASSDGLRGTSRSFSGYVGSTASGLKSAFTDEDRTRSMGKDAGDSR